MNKKTISLRLVVSISITIGMLLLAGIILFQNFRNSVDNTMFATRVTAKHVSDSINMSIRFPLAPSGIILRLLSNTVMVNALTVEERIQRLPLFVSVLNENPLTRAVFIGYDSGEIFLVRRASEKGIPFMSDMPETASFIVQSKSLNPEGSFLDQVFFFDAKLHLIKQLEVPYNIDPRQRKWFKLALATDDIAVTKPYIFYTTGDVGITVAAHGANKKSVVGLDIATTDISNVLAELRITPNTEMIIVDSEQNIFAYQDIDKLGIKDNHSTELPTLNKLEKPILNSIIQNTSKYGVLNSFRYNNEDWFGIVSPITALRGSSFFIVIAIPANELLAEVWSDIYKQALIALSVVAIMLIIGWQFGRSITKPLHHLTEQVINIGNFDFNKPIESKSILTEVQRLAQTLSLTRDTVRRFLQISFTLNKEKDLERMLENILGELLQLVQAKHGGIYLYNEKSGQLSIAVEQGVHYENINLTNLDISDENLIAIIQQQINGDEIIIPLRNRKNELIGCFCLENPGNAENRDALIGFMEQISKSAAVAIETRQLILAQKTLLDAIISLIAGAIDAKSKYTGGHCLRVPQIALNLLDKILEDQSSVFSDFKMSENQKEEFRIAAWLHDCGKITTPEHVVDKATKLEMIYNRIHEIRMRFEVLHREAELSCLKNILNGVNPIDAEQQCLEEQAKLAEEFAFIAKCNVGGEFMKDEDLERLYAIAKRTWLRYFDDTLGLSHEEGERVKKDQTLPVVEQLLADKETDKIPWTKDGVPPVEASDPRNIWGFDMKAPKYMANHGELYNLGIRRGTLNDEERFKINDHIVQTIKMLSALPFPKAMEHIPDIAGAHHEKMDGTGYPRRWNSEQMGVTEKVLAVADVFEALTAADRPYKSGKKLSEAISIMSRMAKEKHLDIAVFNFLLTSGVYLDYAKQNLALEQIDAFDIQKFIVSE
ncbi:HD domain-containing phosphohydrolase [Desulfovibrio litoralis]|uniref:HD domain-containing protein n=1 Tax=Desulfovibrio litoralis DSM 11393 TaxID=1121455 RepID=A0A1M7RU74_9BACT|nr:HD domain-containing phosphohydrolase [Desulfovibrio litoralis]SHN49877.1 HD domain-containing protein [Desulfovibrio litoralis DSM 11393]